MKDKYLEFLALGKTERTGEQFSISMMGSVNFSGTDPDDKPFSLYLYPDSLRLAGERTVDPHDMSGTMRSHLSSKRLADLPVLPVDGKAGGTQRAGWSVAIDLSSAQGGEFVFRQTAQGERTQSVSSDAAGHVERAGGPEAIWAALDKQTLP